MQDIETPDYYLVDSLLNDDVRGFLVESGTPGFKASPIKEEFSYRTSPTALLVFKDCKIPEESLLQKTKV